MKDAIDILDKTIPLFANKGYAGTSISDICAACSASRPTVYYHYQSKQGLYRSAFQKACKDAASSPIWNGGHGSGDSLFTMLDRIGRILASDDELAVSIQFLMMEFLHPFLTDLEKATCDLCFIRNRAWKLVTSVQSPLEETDREYLLEVIVAQLILLRFRYLRAKQIGSSAHFAEHMLGRMSRYTTIVVKKLTAMSENRNLAESCCTGCSQQPRERLWDPS